MKRLFGVCAVGLALVGCGGEAARAEARKKLEATQATQREEEARAQALSAEVERLKTKLDEAGTTRATERRTLEELQKRLAAGWRGDASILKTQVEAADMPAALAATLEEAQKAMGGEALEQRYRQGVAKGDLALVSTVVSQWSSADGVTPVPEEAAEPEAPQAEAAEACEQVKGDFRCSVLPLGGAGDGVTQVCRLEGTGRAWVVRSDRGRLASAQLVPGDRAARYRPVRMLGPDVWMLRDDAGEGKPGVLDVFQVSGTQALRRLSVDLLRNGKTASLVDLDLDADGVTETLVVAGNEVEAVHLDSGSGALSLWRDAVLCPLVEKRTEKELEGALAACATWRKSLPAAPAPAPATP
ncbi:hypothetical protein [Pyxidicoccus xibeiensis]|uniref:hypothetical protein n=1 Tax=Pyxidicoccus xibeiensis TaxID=2906759 RepID=UPI0020A77C70|nr:hypothetical protein [Pyxidicoccus xibeiensis]MCP3139129.1 hypothetical protein [Pyxidicoccus xibeiensis]